MVQKPRNDAEHKERRIDLSLPQVAGSAVAAVAAAVMASQLGVYGTIAGAGVMSVVATCGGSVFQHFFRRTGEQIREVTVQVKHPGGRQVTVHTRETAAAERSGREGTEAPAAATPPDDGATTVLRTAEPDPGRTRLLRPDPERTQLLHTAESGPERTRLLRAKESGPERTRLLRPDPERMRLPGSGPSDDVYSDGHTHGTRIRGWKRSALAAAAVFAVSMTGITTYELVSGNGLSGSGSGATTVGSVVRGDRDAATADPTPSSGTDQERDDDQEVPSGSGTGTAPGTDPGAGTSATPDTGTGGASTDEPAPTPSGSAASPDPTATPTAPEEGVPAAPDPTGEAPTQQQDGATAETDTAR
ncbi:hypothetical protein OG596_08635 [Streptomyces sp. NBC_01102]|uniref:hypothetical protein n=1 Tax=Streptomyces sp. NBC_01102 TaxID=2903749 RepID=UPI0038651697|nr:hypothetical protein OG596_08635 [Streptomyces sp. NBC_01102]